MDEGTKNEGGRGRGRAGNHEGVVTFAATMKYHYYICFCTNTLVDFLRLTLPTFFVKTMAFGALDCALSGRPV